MSTFILNNDAFKEIIQEYRKYIIYLEEYRRILNQQRNLLYSSQEFKGKDMIISQLNVAIRKIDNIIEDINTIERQGNQISQIYDETEVKINQIIDSLSNGNAITKNRESLNTIPFHTLNFNNNYIPSIFSKNILAEDWLIELIQRLNF